MVATPRLRVQRPGFNSGAKIEQQPARSALAHRQCPSKMSPERRSGVGDGLLRSASPAGRAACRLGLLPGHGLQIFRAQEPDQDAVSFVIPGDAWHYRDLYFGLRVSPTSRLAIRYRGAAPGGSFGRAGSSAARLGIGGRGIAVLGPGGLIADRPGIAVLSAGGLITGRASTNRDRPCTVGLSTVGLSTGYPGTVAPGTGCPRISTARRRLAGIAAACGPFLGEPGAGAARGLGNGSRFGFFLQTCPARGA